MENQFQFKTIEQMELEIQELECQLRENPAYKKIAELKLKIAECDKELEALDNDLLTKMERVFIK